MMIKQKELIRDRSLFKCQGAATKVGGGGGHVNFHVASRGGVAINFDFLGRGRGVIFKIVQ